MRELTGDELSKLPDNNLRELFLRVRSSISKNKKQSKDTIKEEVYYCYICREIERRNAYRK